jgi:hypothetical protein
MQVTTRNHEKETAQENSTEAGDASDISRRCEGQRLVPRRPHHNLTMKLRIYAAAVTLALIAALTNPSEQTHHAKLLAAYPWVSESLLADEQMRVHVDHAAGHHLTYWNYGVVSAVTAYPRWVPCPTGVFPRLWSFGLLGFVFLKHFPTAT